MSLSLIEKLEKAFQAAITGSIYAYYPLEELDPPITPNLFLTPGDDGILRFKLIWWDDDTSHSTYIPDVANSMAEKMKNQLIEELKSRNVIISVEFAKVIQEFNWNDKYYDLDNHSISYAVLFEGSLTEVIGTVFKNQEDFSDEYFNKTMQDLSKKITVNHFC